MPDLLDLAYDLKDRQARDPRDRLYALAGFRPSIGERRLLVDYSKPVERVCTAYVDLITSDPRSTVVVQDATESRRQDATPFAVQMSGLNSSSAGVWVAGEVPLQDEAGTST